MWSRPSPHLITPVLKDKTEASDTESSVLPAKTLHYGAIIFRHPTALILAELDALGIFSDYQDSVYPLHAEVFRFADLSRQTSGWTEYLLTRRLQSNGVVLNDNHHIPQDLARRVISYPSITALIRPFDYDGLKSDPLDLVVSHDSLQEVWDVAVGRPTEFALVRVGGSIVGPVGNLEDSIEVLYLISLLFEKMWLVRPSSDPERVYVIGSFFRGKLYEPSGSRSLEVPEDFLRYLEDQWNEIVPEISESFITSWNLPLSRLWPQSLEGDSQGGGRYLKIVNEVVED